MADFIGRHGTSPEITVVAGQQLAVYSKDAAQIYQKIVTPNHPIEWVRYARTAAGTEYLSGAIAAGGIFKIDAGWDDVWYETGAAPAVFEPLADQVFSDATGTITGASGAAGGAATLVGGTATAGAAAGGTAEVLGGSPGAGGAGGPAKLTGAAGDAAGIGGAGTVTGGAGGATNAAGGAASVIGGAGTGTGSGAAGEVKGGASGAGATGNGGQAKVTGGTPLSAAGNGGSVVLTPGAKTGAGLNGVILHRGVSMFAQGAPTAKTTNIQLTAAELLTQIITGNQGAGGTAAYQLPASADLDTAIPDSSAGDAFDLYVINLSVVAAEDITITTAGGWTLVGNMEVQSRDATTNNSSGHFMARKTGAGAWVLYRLA